MEHVVYSLLHCTLQPQCIQGMNHMFLSGDSVWNTENLNAVYEHSMNHIGRCTCWVTHYAAWMQSHAQPPCAEKQSGNETINCIGGTALYLVHKMAEVGHDTSRVQLGFFENKETLVPICQVCGKSFTTNCFLFPYYWYITTQASTLLCRRKPLQFCGPCLLITIRSNTVTGQ